MIEGNDHSLLETFHQDLFTIYLSFTSFSNPQQNIMAGKMCVKVKLMYLFT